MKQKVILTIEVIAEFGSEFQKEIAMAALKGTITTWKLFYMSKHKDNFISIDIYETELKGGE